MKRRITLGKFRFLRGVRGGALNPFAATHWSRSAVANFLGLSTRTIRYYEDRKLIPWVVDEYGQRWFDPEQIRRLSVKLAQERAGSVNPRFNEGDLHAYVFSRFRNEATIGDIVLETSQPVSLIRKLWDEYNFELGDLPTKEISELEKLTLERKRLENRRLKLKLDREEERRRERAHEARMSEIERETKAIRKDREAREANLPAEEKKEEDT